MKPSVAGVCNRCGGPNSRLNHRWCVDCFNKARTNRWRARKIEMVERKGGCCTHCGWKPKTWREYAAMDFHHTDPSTKDMPLAGNMFLSRKREAEAAKCVLVCANCHRIHHALEWEAPPGIGVAV